MEIETVGDSLLKERPRSEPPVTATRDDDSLELEKKSMKIHNQLCVKLSMTHLSFYCVSLSEQIWNEALHGQLLPIGNSIAWLGRHGPIEWPARSSVLTPAYFDVGLISNPQLLPTTDATKFCIP